MKKTALPLALLLLITAYTDARTEPGGEKRVKRVIAFTENKGQVHDQYYKSRPDVLYGVVAGDMAVHIRNNGVSYQLHRIDALREVTEPLTRKKQHETERQTIQRVDLNWINCNTHLTGTSDGVLQGSSNYYLANCPDGVLNVKSYQSVSIRNLYDGIDLHYYEKNGELKYDYVVAPGTDYKQIQIQVSGAWISTNEDGSLMLETESGRVNEGAPLVFQKEKQLKARWSIQNNILSFQVLDEFDPTLELVIDPVTRLWGTYYGGTGEDKGLMTTTDAAGNVYTGGTTGSQTGTVIATTGAHQLSFGGGLSDGFLAKFSNAGSRLWSTYYGGSGLEDINACAVDASGNIYIAGNSASGSGIASGGHQMSNNGGSDAILVKFSSNGLRQWATYYGGGSVDIGWGCAADASGNVYLCGYTSGGTGTIIVTSGAHQTAYGGGTTDGFLVKFDGNGVRQWGTYYGGSSGQEVAIACAIDISGNVYMTGYSGTATGTLIATAASHQPVYGGGSYDAYLAKFNSNGVRQWATYYGGTSPDFGQACATDLNGDIDVAGSTASGTGTIMATASGQQNIYGGGIQDGFLAKFNPNGVRLWATYYGGSGNDGSTSLSCDQAGNVFMSGISALPTTTNIATAASHQPTHAGGPYDAYLVKFNGNGIRQWGTYYGDTGEDLAYSCSADLYGSVYLYGYTSSATGSGIATPNSHQPSYGAGTYDAFLARFDVCDIAPVQPTSISGSTSVCSASGAQNYSVAVVPGATSYTWSLPAGWSGSGSTNMISATPGSSGVFTVTAGNSCGASPQETLPVTVLPSPTVSVAGGTICNGQSFTLSPGGATTYSYSSGPIVTPGATNSYSVTGTSSAGCVSSTTAVATIFVNPLPTVTASTTSSVLCTGEQATLTAGGALNYTFIPGGTGSNVIISPGITTTYSVTGTDANGCSNRAAITQTVTDCTGIGGEHLSPGIRIYPNPVRETLSIRLKNSQEVVIMNAAGQIVYSHQLSAGDHSIDMENLSPGLYMVRITKGSDTRLKKIIKE